MLSFALKNEHKERYGKRWFKETTEGLRPRRQATIQKYVTPFCKTDRMKSNPVNYMTRKLNEHYGH